MSSDANGCPLQAAKGGKKKRKRAGRTDPDPDAELDVPSKKKRQLFAEPAPRNSNRNKSSLLEGVADIWLQQAGVDSQLQADLHMHKPSSSRSETQMGR